MTKPPPHFRNGRAPADRHPPPPPTDPAVVRFEFKLRAYAPTGGEDVRQAFYKFKGDAAFITLLTDAGLGRRTSYKLIVREAFRRSTTMREFTSFLPMAHQVTVRWRPPRTDWGFLVEVYPPDGCPDLTPGALARTLEAFVEKTTTPEEDAVLRRLDRARAAAAQFITRLVGSTQPGDYDDRAMFVRAVRGGMPADLEDLAEEALDALADLGAHAWRGPVLAPAGTAWMDHVPPEPVPEPVPEEAPAVTAPPDDPLDKARRVAALAGRLHAAAQLQPRLAEAETKVTECRDRLAKETARLQKELADAEADRNRVAAAILDQMRGVGPDALLDLAAALGG